MRNVEARQLGAHDVPSQLAWLDLLKSEEMDGNTEARSVVISSTGKEA